MGMLESIAGRFDPDMAMKIGVQLVFVALILAVTWLVAKAVKWGIAKLVDRVRFLQRAGGDGQSIGESVGKILSLVIWLMGIIVVLDQLELNSIMVPVQNLLDSLFDAVPTLVLAGVTFFFGLVVARIVRQIVETALGSANLDGWAKRAGFANVTGGEEGATSLSSLIATLSFIAVIIPVSIRALDVLGIESISVPAKNVLQTILDVVPLLIGAVLLLGIAYFIARWLKSLLTQILGSLGFDKSVQAIGIFPASVSASAIVSNIALLAIMLFAGIEATRMLHFAALSDLLNAVVSLGGKVLFGAVIIGIGAALSRAVSGLFVSATGESGLSARIVQFAIIFLFAAMGLKYMGIADSIVNLAFGAIMVGGAVAAALAFGLGGRDAAARLLADASAAAGKATPAKPASVKAAPAKAAPAKAVAGKAKTTAKK